MNESRKCAQLPVDPARRHFLASGVMGLAVGIGLVGHASELQPRDAATAAPWWLRVTGEREAVTSLGNGYLRLYPEERNLGMILAEIAKDTPVDVASETITTPLTERIKALEAAVRRDYQQGELVMVNSWLLSRTEARLYAAAALFYESARD